jgi:hypothetical protein
MNRLIIAFLLGVGAGAYAVRHSREILKVAVKTSTAAGQRLREAQEAVAEDIEDDLAEIRAKKSASKSQS